MLTEILVGYYCQPGGGKKDRRIPDLQEVVQCYTCHTGKHLLICDSSLVFANPTRVVPVIMNGNTLAPAGRRVTVHMPQVNSSLYE